MEFVFMLILLFVVCILLMFAVCQILISAEIPIYKKIMIMPREVIRDIHSLCRWFRWLFVTVSSIRIIKDVGEDGEERVYLKLIKKDRS